jgi:hypothetical protein
MLDPTAMCGVRGRVLGHRTTAKALLAKHKLEAAHALYRLTGDWFHVLRQFPGALCDATGRINFPDRDAYDEFVKDSAGIGVRESRETNTLRVRDGIAKHPSYAPFVDA